MSRVDDPVRYAPAVQSRVNAARVRTVVSERAHGTATPGGEDRESHLQRWCLGLLVAAFVGQGLLFITLTPPWQAPDEPSNLGAIARLAHVTNLGPTHRGVPDAIYYSEIQYRMAEVIAWPPPALQPSAQPLPVATPSGASPTAPAPVASPPADTPRFGMHSGTLSLYNILAVPAFVAGSPAGILGALYAVRALGVLLGALAVVFTFFLARELRLGGSVFPALAAAAVAFVPQFGFITASVNKDSLAAASGAAALWLIARMARRGVTPRGVTTAGAAVALGALAKPTLLALAVPLAVTAALAASLTGRRREATRLVGGIAVALVLIGGAAAVLPVHALGYVRVLTHSHALAVAHVLTQRDVLIYTFTTFWGDFSWLNAPLSSLTYAGLFVLTVAAAAGVIRFAVRRGRALTVQDPAAVAILGGLVAAVAAFAGVIVVGQANGFGSQGRFLFPVIAAIAVLLALGFTHLFPALARRHGVVLALLAAGGFDLLILLRQFPDRFGIL